MNDPIERTASLRSRLATTAFWIAGFSLALLLVTRYITQEKFIYFWDYVQYQQYYAELGPMFLMSPYDALHAVLITIRQNDYNLLPALFLVPFRDAFGPGRLAYILSMTVSFVLPAIVFFPFVVRRLKGSGAAQSALDAMGLTLLSVLAFALMPQLWVPVLLGYIDVGGLIIIFVILILYFRTDLADQSIGNLVSMALLLSLLVMYRRWYAYWVVGFFGALAVCEGLRCVRDQERRARWMFIARNTLIMGSISLVSFLVIAAPIARKMLATDYGDIYSAYHSKHPIIHNLGALYDHFGLLTLVLAGLGVVFSAMNRKRRPVVYFLCAQFAIAFVLYSRTQDFAIQQNLGDQHFYLVLATVALFLSFFAHDVFVWAVTRPRKAAILLIFLIVSMANFSATFAHRADRLLKPIAFALPRLRQYPLVRTDLDQVQALLSSLDDLSKEPGSTVYILASSLELNSSIAQQGAITLKPSHPALASKIWQTNDVDKRDGFPVQFLRARYVVLTIPYGYHLAPDDQRVIGILADQLEKGEGIGKSYERLDFEFRLEEGSNALIYKKVRPFDPAAVKMLSDVFLDLYPNYKDKFEISPDVIRGLNAL